MLIDTLSYTNRLDALEKEEARYAARLRSISNKEAPEPIGLAVRNDGDGRNSSRSLADPPASAQQMDDPDPPPARSRPLFWNQSSTAVEL